MSMPTTCIGMTVSELIKYFDKIYKNYIIEICQDNFPSMYFNKAGNYLVNNAALMRKITNYQFDIDNPDKSIKIKVWI